MDHAFKHFQQHPPSALGATDFPPSSLTLFPSLDEPAAGDPILREK